MEDLEHYAQDALELYAVAVLQREAEARGAAITADAADKIRRFVEYAAKHDLTEEWFTTGPLAMYKASYDRNLPAFVDRLALAYADQKFDFEVVEAEYRVAGLKGDFVIRMQPAAALTSVSLKNYRGDIRRPQFNAQTFNSFVLSFLFAGKLGTYEDPITGETFRGSSAEARNAALERNGFGSLVPSMRALDALNQEIRVQFVYAEEFAFLTTEGERIFKAAAKRIGVAGADIVAGILAEIGQDRIKRRLLKMIGLDGAEELLMMDQTRCTDTLTHPGFRALREAVQKADVTVARGGQSIQLLFTADGIALLPVTVPFTINKNGAWISRKVAAEGIMKDGRLMLPGERRNKAKEMATSINTYVNFAKTKIFD